MMTASRCSYHSTTFTRNARTMQDRRVRMCMCSLCCDVTMDGFWFSVLKNSTDTIRYRTNYGTKRTEQLLKVTVQTPFIQKSTNGHRTVTWPLDGHSFYWTNNIKRSKERSSNGHMNVWWPFLLLNKRLPNGPVTVSWPFVLWCILRWLFEPFDDFWNRSKTARLIYHERNGTSLKQTERKTNRAVKATNEWNGQTNGTVIAKK